MKKLGYHIDDDGEVIIHNNKWSWVNTTILILVSIILIILVG